MAHILVTGAAGFIGRHTVDQLLAAGHRVCGVDNFRTGRRENLTEALSSAEFKLHECDVLDVGQFHPLLEKTGVEAIIHLAALVGVPESIANPALNDRLNFQATRIVAEGAIRHGVARVVFASSAAVYGDPTAQPIEENAPKQPLSPYGSAKLASEELLLDWAKRHGLVVRCQRYFNVYGPLQDPSSPYSGVISLFLSHFEQQTTPTIFDNGEQTRDFISVYDVARANVLAATRSAITSGTVNICTGRALSVNRLWQLLAGHYPGAKQPRYAAPRPGDIRHSCGLPDAARRELEFQAETELVSGLAEMARGGLFPGSNRPAQCA